MRRFGRRFYRSLHEVLTDLGAAVSGRETLRSAMRDEGLDTAFRERVGQQYGSDVLERIETVLRMIRMGNLIGINMDYVLYRVSFGRWGVQDPTQPEAQGV